MRRDRLQKLAQYLLTVPAEKFNLSTWSCGTTACAVGHACSIKEFFEDGLYLKQDGAIAWPAYEEHQGFNAVAAFFDISHRDAYRMFSPDSYEIDNPQISDVISRIETTADFRMHRYTGEIFYAFKT